MAVCAYWGRLMVSVRNFRRFLISIIVLLTSSVSYADAFLSDGDYNKDGLLDILVSIGPRTSESALISGIPTPVINYDTQLVLQKRRDGYFDKILITSSNVNSLDSVQWRDSKRNIFTADFDANGVEDLFIQANTGDESSVIIYNDTDTNPVISTIAEQTILKSKITAGGQSISLSANASTLWISPGTNYILASDGFSTFTITAKANGRFDFADTSLVKLSSLDYYGGDVPDSAPPYSSLVPGATPSSLDVDESGNANFSIPLSLPVGSAGVQPSLSISYRSGGSDGVLGHGWSLVGLSAVHRCAKTKVDDGQDGSISFSANDRFCLDGQRLIVVSSTASLTEYRTADESFSRIKSYGSATNPDRFEVENKSGETVTFGNTLDSKITTAGQGVVWSVNKFQDRFNNAVTFTYLRPTGDQQYIDKISYANASVEVRFNYLDRASAKLKDIVSYSGGGKSLISKRLSEIQVYVESKQAHSYWFNYRRAPIADVLQLKGVTECATRYSGGTKECFKPLTFNYNDGGEPSAQNVGSAGVQTFPTAEEFGQRLSLDFDGDGFQDQIILKKSTSNPSLFGYDLYRNTHDGKLTFLKSSSFSLSWSSLGSYDTPIFFVMDFGQDGQEDVAWIARKSDTGNAYFDSYGFNSSGDPVRKFAVSPAVGAWSNRTSSNPSNFYVFDTNADRRPDIVRIDPTNNTKANLTVWTMNSSGAYTQLTTVDLGSGIYPPPPSIGELKYKTQIQNFDYDGDSYQDIIVLTPDLAKVSGTLTADQKNQLCNDADAEVYQETTTAKIFLSQINGTFAKTKDAVVASHYVCSPYSGEDQAYINLSFLKKNAVQDQQYYPGDYNGDGVTDLFEVFKQAKSKRYQLLLGTPQGNSPFTAANDPVTLREADDKNYPDIIMPADLNGDDRTDIMLLRKSDTRALFIPMISNGLAFDNLVPMDVGAYQSSSVACDGGYTPLDINADGLVELIGGVSTVSGTTCTLDNRVIRLKSSSAYSPPYTLKSVKNGMGLEYQIDYKPLTDPAVYTKDDQAVTDGLNVILPQPVVSEARTSNGLGGFTRTTYSYFGLKTNLTGYGNLGFRKITEIEKDPLNSANDRKTETLYLQDTSKDTVGKVEQVATGKASWTLSDKYYTLTKNTWNTVYLTLSGGKTRFTYLDTEKKTSHDIDGLTDLSVSTTTNQYLADGVTGTSFAWDSSIGNVKKITSTVSSGTRTPTGSSLTETYTTTTTNTYKADDQANWILGRVERTTVARKGRNHNGVTVPQITRTSSWEYNTNGTLFKEYVEPDSTALMQVTQYGYNARGIRNTLTESGSRIKTPRTTTTEFDSNGLRAVSVTNTKLQKEITEYDPFIGLVTKKSVPIDSGKSLDTYTKYDAFGRVIQVTMPDGTYTSSQTSFCDSYCPDGAAYYIASTSSTGGVTETYFDSLGRVIKAGSKGFDGAMIYVSTIYDVAGRQVQTSEPWKSTQGAPQYWTKVTGFDDWDRPTAVTDPRNLTTANSYTADCKTITNENAKTVTSCTNVLGLPSRTQDHDGKILVFAYDAYDHLILTQDKSTSPVTQTAATYDLRGNKTSMFDPDLNRVGSVSVNVLTGVVSITGGNTFYYDGFRQITGSVDAKGQKTCIAYDELGRMKKRIDGYTGNVDTDSWNDCANDSDSTTAPTRTSEWKYDQAANGLGKIAFITGPDGYLESFTYDALGRPITSVKTIKDGAGALQTFTTATSYDTSSRPDVITYPGDFKVKQEYNSAGAMFRLTDVSQVTTGAVGKILWTAQATNQRGQITSEVFGNNVESRKEYQSETGWLTDSKAWTIGAYDVANPDIVNIHTEWDGVGNLSLREDLFLKTKEIIGYDNINRINSVKFSYNGGAVTDQTNSYLPNGNINKKFGVGTYTYATKPSYCTAITGAVLPGPHAVSSIADASGGVEASKPATYCYDANGNMLASSTGRAIKWTNYDMPSEITKGSVSAKFWYGPDRARYKRVDVKDGITTTTLYSSNYEKVSYSNTTPTEQRYYVGGVAVVTVKNNDLTGRATNFMHTDHLGSVIAITGYETESVNNVLRIKVKERASFDPWGKRRDIAQVATWGSNSSAVDWWNNYKSSFTTRGYTGQEQIDSLGLIHMNGRVYDPEIGRFISADPIVQAPGNIQSYNRYSYVMNNPLTLTDPSGFSWWSKTWNKVKNFAKRALHAIKRINEAVVDAAMVPWRETKRLFMRVPALQQIATIAVCAATAAATAGLGCAAFQGLMTWGMTGDLSAGLTAFAWGVATVAVWGGVHTFGASPVGQAIGGVGRTIVHGVVGGAIAKLQGGDFRSAFFANALGKGVYESGMGYQGSNLFAHSAEAALVGGTASALSGGSFANGAKTAAMARLFNDAGQGFGQSLGQQAFYNQLNSEINSILEPLSRAYDSINSKLTSFFSNVSGELNISLVAPLGTAYSLEVDGGCVQGSVAFCAGGEVAVTAGANYKFSGPSLSTGAYPFIKGSLGIVPAVGANASVTKYYNFTEQKWTNNEWKGGVATGVDFGGSACGGVAFNGCF